MVKKDVNGLAINKGTAVGILYVQLVNGKWQTGVHNGSTDNTITSTTSPAVIWHVGKKGSIERNRLYFYKTVEEYQRARMGKGPKGVPPSRLYARVLTESYTGVPVGFLRSDGSANNGAFKKFTTAKGKVYDNVSVLINDLKNKKVSQADFRGGKLEYLHYNIQKRKEPGRYDFILETPKPVTELIGIRRLDKADEFFKI
ncbi:hypothetical protein J2Z37_004520 [Ammoniphilus resinae]|uniref:Uncharacterized protein n=1 Tax=Ammoniphilus resinae TaxID=861532 RepID=A0ABS4GW55_9BACL|nr:hypothetical protein [Ammoniphilus resinae]